jgi:hypothetical protein
MTHSSQGAGSACHSEDALQLIVSAWEEGLEAGISADLMTFAALYTGLSDLVDARGEMQAALFMERLAVRVRDGEFSGSAPRQ